MRVQSTVTRSPGGPVRTVRVMTLTAKLLHQHSCGKIKRHTRSDCDWTGKQQWVKAVEVPVHPAAVCNWAAESHHATAGRSRRSVPQLLLPNRERSRGSGPGCTARSFIKSLTHPPCCAARYKQSDTSVTRTRTRTREATRKSQFDFWVEFLFVGVLDQDNHPSNQQVGVLSRTTLCSAYFSTGCSVWFGSVLFGTTTQITQLFISLRRF